MSIPVVAFTGAPCGGKSMAVEAIRQQFAGKVVVVPEMASTILAGFPLPGRDLEWSSEWQDCLQRTILRAQLEAEEAWRAAAIHQNAKIILCDRGVLDGAAYRGVSAQQFCVEFGIDLNEVHARYTGVLHLQSLAEFSPELYTANMASNPHRFESAARAQELDRALLLAWRGHSNHEFIPADASIGRKLDQVVEFVQHLI